jgi:alkylation response protein AidB-like acyl-CoA dehydrogenase
MRFGLSPDQTLLQDSLGHFLRDQVPLARVRRFAEAAEGKGEGRATELIAGLAELGVTALLVPEAHGGLGAPVLDACLVAEALGHHVAPVPFVASAAMVPRALQLAGSPAQQADWLPRIAAGQAIVGAALAERTGARADGGVQLRGGRLHGRALFVLDFEADAYLVADATGGLHLAAADAPGLTRIALETIDRTRPIGELVLDHVAADALPGANPDVCRQVLDLGRVLLAADTLGAAQAMLDQAVAYAKQRVQFGRPIGTFQAVKHLCAEMAAQLEPTRAFVWYAGHAIDTLPAEAHGVACHLKAHLSEVGRFVAKTATEVHGGMGFTDLLGLHYWFKRIGFDRQMLGSPERLRREAAVAQGLLAQH